MKRTLWAPMILGLAAIILAGCLITGTFVLVLDLPTITANSTGTFSSTEVDLTEEDVWEDHKDDVENITDVRFRADFTATGNTADGTIYFSSNRLYQTPEAVRAASDAFIVFTGFSVPAGQTRTMTFAESAQYRQGLTEALELIESGEFYVYALTPSGPFELQLTDVHVLVTFDAGI